VERAKAHRATTIRSEHLGMIDARELVYERYARILRPSDNAPIYVWARQIKLDSTSPIAGSYRIENSMWLKPLYDAYQADSTRMLTVIGPNQGGRTKLMEVCSLWAAKHRPGPMQWNTITDKRAKDFAEERWWPMAKSCEDIVAKLPAGGVSEGKNRHQERIQKVIFTDGMPFIVQGCTESNLEEKSIMTQFNDECFQWPVGRLEYAWIRCNVAYAWNYKIINGSAAGVDGDDIHETFKSGTQEELHWHCLKCGFPHIPIWGEVGKRGGIKWETDSKTKPGGVDWDYDEVKKTVRYECPNCNEGVYEDASRIRRQLNETIQYVAQNPEPRNGIDHSGSTSCR
jgi:phage terminase large subunit GpA-like protein